MFTLESYLSFLGRPRHVSEETALFVDWDFEGAQDLFARATDWEYLASQCDLRKQFVRGLVGEVGTSISERVGAVRRSFDKRFRPYPALQRVESVIRKQCRPALSS